jgi:probable F420-dependent oxidoreductase
MKFGVIVQTYGSWANPAMVHEGVAAAEDLGFDTVWFGDHVVMPSYATAVMSDAWLEPLASALVEAGRTSRIRFGIDVLVLPYRHPVLLSQMVAAADLLTNGRLTLGVGVGWCVGEFQAVGAPPYKERGAVTDEYLQVLRYLWETQGELTYKGQWVSFENIHAAPKPMQQPFPLWVGGNAKVARRRAALLGNGWHPLFVEPSEYAACRDEILALRAEQGITEDFTFSYSGADAAVTLSERERPDPVVSFSRPQMGPEFDYAPPPPRTADGRPLLVGNPDELIESLDALAAAGVEQLTLRFAKRGVEHDLPWFLDQLERFARLVAPHYTKKS